MLSLLPLLTVIGGVAAAVSNSTSAPTPTEGLFSALTDDYDTCPYPTTVTETCYVTEFTTIHETHIYYSVIEYLVFVFLS